MQVGLDTLLLMTVDIEAMLGLLLLFVWVQNTTFMLSPGGDLRICCGLSP